MAEPPQKRFRYETYTQQINNIAVDTGKTRPLAWDEQDEAGPSTIQTTPFTAELDRLSQLDLTLPFQDLQRSLQPLTTTLPITLLNLPKIAAVFHDFYSALSSGQDLVHSGLDSALQLHRAIFETTLGEAVPHTAQAVEDITRVAALKALEPKLVERSYSTLSLILRSVASSLLKSDQGAQQALASTWAAVRPYLSAEHKRYVRRCVADAWVGIIRKARGEGLQRLMELLLQDETEGMEAIWAHSLRGTTGQLHSRALPIYDSLLDDLIKRPEPTRLSIVKKVTTALVHHTTSSTITPIIEAILKRVYAPSSSDSASAYILRILSTSLFTRKGKRYPESLLKPTMLRLSSLFGSLNVKDGREEWRESLLEAVVGVLMAGKLAQWLSPGVTMIEKLWDEISAEERFAFTNALIKLKWSGVEQFIIPHIARTILPSLETDPLHALILLNNLAEAGFLSRSLFSVQGGRWRQSLIKSLGLLVDRVMAAGYAETEDRRILGQTLHLLSSIATAGSDFIDRISTLVDQLLQRAEGQASYRDSWLGQGVWNDAHLLAESLGVMETFLHGGTEARPKLTDQLGVIIQQWSWNRDVMARLAGLIELRASDVRPKAWDINYLYSNLLSGDGVLRSSTLKIIVTLHDGPTSASSTDADIWRSCLQVESAEMSLKNVRERTTQIARLGRLLSSSSDHSDVTISRVITYLLSQLKVNFRPIYPEITKAVAEVGQKHGELVWEGIWQELEKVSKADNASLLDLGYVKPGWAIINRERATEVEEEEDEPEYRCHNAEKMVSAVKESWGLSSDVNELDSVEISVPRDRLDVLNYESQLLGSLAAISLTTEKHTRILVPAFFSIANQLENTDEATLSSHLSTRQRQQRTANWMELFTKFVNPKAAYRSSELHDLYLRVLSKGDVKLQGLAVSCLMTYKSANLVPYEENLRNLLDDSKFRDELARFDLGQNSEAINDGHRDEIVPVSIRLLYGILTARRGRSSAQGLAARKRAVLTAVSGCSSTELSVLIDLMLESFESETGELSETAGRQQMGYLSLLADVLKHLAPQTTPFWPRLLDATIKLIGKSQDQIDKEGQDIIDVEGEDLDEDVIEESGKGTAPVRHIRTTGIKRLVQFFRARVDFNFEPFMARIFSVVITPRLAKLDVENTQAPSGVLDLIAAIASLPEEAKALIEYDERTLPQTFACLTAVKVKPAVIARVFDIIDSLLERDSSEILLQHVRPLLANVIRYVEGRTHTSNDDLMRRLLAILSRISVIVTDGEQAQQLAALLCPMLRQAGKQQPEKMKIHVLDTLRRLFTISPDFGNPTSEFFTRSYDLLSNLLQSVFLPATRRAVINALETFAISDPTLAETIRITADLNSFSAKRIEEPDFDRRLTAFAAINDAPQSDLPQTIREWAPLLRSALFFIKDPEELSLRTNSSALLKRFIDLVGTARDGAFVDVVNHTILPGLRQSLRSRLELVRSEAIVVVEHAVKTCDGISSLVELKPLIGEDDDTSFFSNISHIQVHRRARALRRLREIVATHDIRETTIANIFLPILEHIIAGSTEVTDHHFVNEAILTVGSLAGKLGWGKYNGVLSRYMKLGSVKSQQQKLYIRTVSAIIDNFHFDLLSEATEMDIDIDAELAKDKGDEEEDQDLEHVEKKRISEIVLNRLLPSLSKFVSQKDENEDNIRIPLAVPTVKLAKQLPIETASNEIIRVVTIVCSILRSKDQDTRDISRDTLGKIALFLGPEWLNRILAELQTALQRGPQKHVAAVTTHSILVLATTEATERFSDLDDAVNSAIRISAEVVWGESGKDAADEGYKTKMREVRGATSRGFDTFQLLARLVSPAKITVLLAPIREVMHASQAVKTMTQVDESLRRVALGLNANIRIQAEDLLTLCHSLINGNSAYLKPKRKIAPTGQAADAYRVQMKRDRKEEDDFYHLNAHKFVTFGLDLFVTAFRRGRFDFDNVEMLSRLGPLVNAIGNTLYSPTASVLSLGLKATAAIARCPIPQVDEALPVFVSNILKVIKQQGGTAETEISQTALKTLAVILRDCKASTLTDTQLRYILEIISPDLEETDRQASIFSILRSIVSRKFVVPEIYDLMGSVSSIMVTSQSTHVQDQCRGVLMAFLLDYPQGKGRIKSQMTFLAQNLDYVYESGRVSVMEFLNTVFIKFTDELIAEYADLFFVALTGVIANDEVEKCRTMAGALLKQLVGRLDVQRIEKLVAVLKSWVESREAQPALTGASLAVFGLLSEGDKLEREVVVDFVQLLNSVIVDSATALHKAESDDSAFAVSELDFTIPHHALVALTKALKIVREASVSVDYDSVISHLLFPHDWVRLGSARAISAAIASSQSSFDASAILDIARKGCILLQGSTNAEGESVPADSKLADQIVKILWSIAKIWSAQDSGVSNGHGQGEDEDHEADEDAPARGGSLAWLMSRMSFVARHIIVHRPSPNAVSYSNTHWSSPLMAILRFFAGVMEHLDVKNAKRFMLHVLSPIYRVLDEGGDLAAESGQQIDDLRQLATEVRDFVQTKVGTTEFSKTWESMRKRVSAKRDERRDARVQMAVRDPKAWAERKSKKVAMKKDSKKRRVKAFAEGRVQSKHMKRK